MFAIVCFSLNRKASINSMIIIVITDKESETADIIIATVIPG